MRTLILTFTLKLGGLGYLVGVSEVIGKIIENLKRFFTWAGVPEDHLSDVNVQVLSVLTGVLFSLLVVAPARHLVRRSLPPVIRIVARWAHLRVGRDRGAERAAFEERKYLEWGMEFLPSPILDWQKSPIIPTPGHKKKPRGTQIKPRPGLSRLNQNDYQQEPGLNNSELSVRASFGRRVRIKNLVKELKKHKKIVVLGDPGSGKSVCLRQLAYDLCAEEYARGGRPATLPVYVEMNTYDGWEDGPPRRPANILKFLKSSLRAHPSISNAPETHALFYLSDRLEEILDEGRATLIFDALDEMPQDSYRQRYQVLKEFIKHWTRGRNNRFIFSCRLLDYDPSFNLDEVIIDPFDKKRIYAFLKGNAEDIADDLYQTIVQDEALEALVSNPFFLQALTYINLEYRAAGRQLWIPATRGELIKEFAEKLLENIEAKQNKYLLQIAGGLTTLRAFLSEVGFALQKRKGGRTFARPESLQEVWAKYPQWKEMLWIAHRARILGKRDVSADRLADTEPRADEVPDRIQFMHHRLQEYFAAEELARRFDRGEAVDQYLEDIWWQETVVFAIPTVKEPHSIIDRMLSPQDDAVAWVGDVLEQAKDPLAYN